MPDRVIRQGILTSDNVNKLSWPAEVFYRRLMNIADDFGRYEARQSILRASLYPLKLDRVSNPDIGKWLAECADAGLVRVYTVNEKEYLELLKFDQRLRAMKSRYPPPADFRMHPHADDSRQRPESESESETETEKIQGAAQLPAVTKVVIKKKFEPPVINQVTAFFLETIGNSQKQNYWPPDRCRNAAAEFMDHYTANGWVQGRGKPIKDWQAACRNWIRNNLKGVFEPKPLERKERTDVPPQKIAQQLEQKQMSKMETEINFYYGMYLENKCTVVSLDALYYNFLKQKGLMIEFTEEQKAELRSKAVKAALPATDDNAIVRMMKKFGVLEYFKQCELQQMEVIF